MLIFALFLSVGAFVLVAETLTRSTRQRRAALARARSFGDIGGEATTVELEDESTFVAHTRERLARLALRVTPSATIESITLKLVEAGLARRVSPMSFLATKSLLAAGGIFLGGVLAISIGGARGILLAPAVGLIGFLLPDLFVMTRNRSRRDRIQQQLPDALDLLAVSVEAGLTFDGAVSKLAEYMEGPLVEEFSLSLHEMRIGQSRQQALRAMSERVAVPEVTVFAQAVIQSEELGSPLGTTLRVQADDARKRRQDAAEERAMKVPVKMMFPTALFIFPAMFIVILAPALLSLTDFF